MLTLDQKSSRCSRIFSGLYLNMANEFSQNIYRGSSLLAVEDSQLGEHAHMRSLESESSLQQLDQLFEVALALVVVVQLFKFISVHDDVKTADLRQSELLVINASEADLNN